MFVARRGASPLDGDDEEDGDGGDGGDGVVMPGS
jgi:hypothetical protein